MKLHLPHGLRKALLACLAALALPASLPSTIASASGIAAVWFLATQQVAIAETIVTDSTGWAAFVGNTEQNKAGGTVALSQTSAGSIYFGQEDETVNANVRFDTDLDITSGYSNSPNGYTYTFNGAFSGNGSFKLVSTVSCQHYVFTGDLSKWGGNIEITGGNGSDSVTFTGENFKSSNGVVNVTANNNSTLIVDGVTLNNSEITASLLEIKNNVSFTGQSVTINGSATIGQGAALTLGAGTQMRVGSLAGESTLTSLTLGAGSEFALDSGSLSLGTLVLDGDNASLAMTWAEGTTLTLGTLEDKGHILTIHLDGLTAADFALFGDAGWKDEWVGKIFVDGEINGRHVKLNEQGMVVLSNEVTLSDQNSLNAAQTGDNKATYNVEGMVWYIDMASGYFTGDATGAAAIKADVTLLQTFKITDGNSAANQVTSVIFDGDLSAKEGVNLEYAWTAGSGNVAYVFNGDLSGFHGDMVVTEAAHEVTFSFAGTTGDGAITNESSSGEGSLKVVLNGTNVNATIHANDLQVTNAVTFNKNVTITGTSTLDASAALTLAAGAQVALGDVTGSLTSLTLEAGSSLSASNGGFAASTLTVNGDATLVVGAGGTLSFDTISGNGHLTIDLTALGGFSTEQLFDADKVSWFDTWAGEIELIGVGFYTLNKDGSVVRSLSDVNYGTAEQYSTEVTVSGETGPKWYSSVTDDSIFNVLDGADLKMSTSGEKEPMLKLSGAINSLYFASDADGTGYFEFASKDRWVMNEGVSIKDIYVDNAELWFDFTVNLGDVNVHLNGCTTPNSYSGALRV